MPVVAWIAIAESSSSSSSRLESTSILLYWERKIILYFYNFSLVFYKSSINCVFNLKHIVLYNTYYHYIHFHAFYYFSRFRSFLESRNHQKRSNRNKKQNCQRVKALLLTIDDQRKSLLDFQSPSSSFPLYPSTVL